VLYYGDNLDVLRRHVDDESVDLIYLDPPFQSGRDHNTFFKSEAQNRAFLDTWVWDQAAAAAYDEVIRTGKPVATVLESFHRFLGSERGGSTLMAYLSNMAIRLLELHKVLKPTGSLYLHCDPSASHYLKVLLDAVFGNEECFKNEIIWKRTNAHNSAKRYGPAHDVILFYGKSDRTKWHPLLQGYEPKYVKKFGKIDESTGQRFKDENLTGPGVRKGPSGQAWRGIFNPTTIGRHWQPASYLYQKYKELTGQDLSEYPLLSRLDRLDELGMIYWPKKTSRSKHTVSLPRYKHFLEDASGIALQDVWTDIDVVNSQADERIGYPTQKPLSLLERIIQASSDEGDLVLDPFCGCGTAVEAAHALGRRWIGIDITHVAIGPIKARLQEAFGEEVKSSIQVVGEPTHLSDARQLATEDRFQFEQWALGLVGARADNKTKGADKGIDGALIFHSPMSPKSEKILFSVKSGKVSSRDVRDLRAVVDREKAAIGVLITLLEPTRDMKAEAAEGGFFGMEGLLKFPRLQIVTIEDLLAGKRIDAPILTGRKPARRVIAQKELVFTKTAR